MNYEGSKWHPVGAFNPVSLLQWGKCCRMRFILSIFLVFNTVTQPRTTTAPLAAQISILRDRKLHRQLRRQLFNCWFLRSRWQLELPMQCNLLMEQQLFSDSVNKASSPSGSQDSGKVPPSLSGFFLQNISNESFVSRFISVICNQGDYLSKIANLTN